MGLCLLFAASLGCGYAWQALSPVFAATVFVASALTEVARALVRAVRGQARDCLAVRAALVGVRLWGPSTAHGVDTETFRKFKKGGSVILAEVAGRAVFFQVEGKVGAVSGARTCA
eukprot:3097823-Amphidinium_carterae.1